MRPKGWTVSNLFNLVDKTGVIHSPSGNGAAIPTVLNSPLKSTKAMKKKRAQEKKKTDRGATRETHTDPASVLLNTVNSENNQQVDVRIQIKTLDDGQTFNGKALLDSGCTTSCIDMEFVRSKSINTTKLPKPIPIYNADGTSNTAGTIKEVVRLRMTVGQHEEVITFAVTNLGKSKVFIGYKWLKHHNPKVNWRTGQITFDDCPKECNIDLIEAQTSFSAKLAAEANQGKKEWVFEEQVPEYLHDFKDVFDEKTFESELPPRRPYDHAIDLKPDWKPIDAKLYPISPADQGEMDKFINKNLASGRIRESKSPILSPFFFIKKKDGSNQPVQDYRLLNEMTVKNRYPLPLISEIIDMFKNAKYITKLTPDGMFQRANNSVSSA